MEEQDLAEVKVWIRNGTHRTPRAQPSPAAPPFSVAKFSPAAAAVQHARWGGAGWRGSLQGRAGRDGATARPWKGKRGGVMH